jgi:hypothetical protein
MDMKWKFCVESDFHESTIFIQAGAREWSDRSLASILFDCEFILTCRVS